MQEERKKVVLITKEKDDIKVEVERLIEEVTALTGERNNLKAMVDQAEQYTTGRLDLVRTLAWTQELSAPPSFSLFRAYELQRDVMLSTLELHRAVNLTAVYLT